MPKIEKGRLDGVWGMRRFTSSELHELADQYEALITDPTNEDDPKWLQRWADKIRRLAERKEKSQENRKKQLGLFWG